jgi:hypothetical protein
MVLVFVEKIEQLLVSKFNLIIEMLEHWRKRIDVNFIMDVILFYINVPVELRKIIMLYCYKSDYDLLLNFIQNTKSKNTLYNKCVVLLGDINESSKLIDDIISDSEIMPKRVNCGYDTLGIHLKYNHVNPTNANLVIVEDSENFIEKTQSFPHNDIMWIILRCEFITSSTCNVICKLKTIESFIDKKMIQLMEFIRVGRTN